MKYKTVLFDLDGTLTDPYLGISNSAKYTLKKFGIVEEDPAKFRLFIGPPLEQSFKEFYGFDADAVVKAVGFYREYYDVKGLYENQINEGIENMLKELNEKNLVCMVATSKLQRFAVRVLENFKIQNYFRDVVGSNDDGTFSDKGEIIAHIIKKHALVKEETVMVGDRKFDILGARAAGIDTVAVGYGYGSAEEFRLCEPAYICKTVADLPGILDRA